MARQAESAEKNGGGRIAQETREAGDLMNEHQGIFGEQRAMKISELVFVPIDSPNILLSDCCIQSVKSCLIEFSANPAGSVREKYLCNLRNLWIGSCSKDLNGRKPRRGCFFVEFWEVVRYIYLTKMLIKYI
jgi:hypothetical protein